MIRVSLYDQEIEIPSWVTDLESFRRWSDDDAFPETGRFAYLKGAVCVDMSKEQLFSHNDVKSEINTVLRLLGKADHLGRYFTEGAFLSNVEADVSNQPDGMFVSSSGLQQGRVRIVEGKSEGYVELEGSPEMVLEVVSPSSVGKDTVILRQAYAEAGIREYWLVDARKDPLRFDILRLRERSYAVGRKRAGWVHSGVFGRWFRLTQQPGPDGFPEFTLHAQTERPELEKGK